MRDDELRQTSDGSRLVFFRKIETLLNTCHDSLSSLNQSEKKCGVTKLTREVECVRQMENSTEGVEIDRPDCLEDLKPAAEKEVFLEACTGVEWAISEWSPCTECGSTVQTRKVQCVNEEGELVLHFTAGA